MIRSVAFASLNASRCSSLSPRTKPVTASCCSLVRSSCNNTLTRIFALASESDHLQYFLQRARSHLLTTTSSTVLPISAAEDSDGIEPSTNMSTTEEPLSERFGNTNYFQDIFEDVDRVNMRHEFNEFNYCRTRAKTDRYEGLRQRYLKLLGQNRMVWQATNPDYDKDVEVSRIYRHDQEEYLAFMRIKPQGFRAERTVAANVEMVFHVLSGRVTFTHRKRQRVMISGTYITVNPGATYSIRCGNEDQPAYLIFRVKG